jgi:hypothetical protein
MESYITFTEPNFDFEWKAAKKYVEFLNLGKEDWIILAKSGKIIEYNEINIKRINNTNASKPETFESELCTDRQRRALKQLNDGNVELPIIAQYNDGWLELVGGNTRLTAMFRKFGKGSVWQFDVPNNLFTNKVWKRIHAFVINRDCIHEGVE